MLRWWIQKAPGVFRGFAKGVNGVAVALLQGVVGVAGSEGDGIDRIFSAMGDVELGGAADGDDSLRRMFAGVEPGNLGIGEIADASEDGRGEIGFRHFAGERPGGGGDEV